MPKIAEKTATNIKASKTTQFKALRASLGAMLIRYPQDSALASLYHRVCAHLCAAQLEISAQAIRPDGEAACS